MLRLDRLQTSCMFQELVLIVAGTAQVPDDIIGALVDLDELLTLLERHAATGVASNAPQAGLEIGTEIGQLFTLCGEAQVGGGLQNLQLLRAFCQLLMTALFRFNVRGVNCKWKKKVQFFTSGDISGATNERTNVTIESKAKITVCPSCKLLSGDESLERENFRHSYQHVNGTWPEIYLKRNR